MIINKIKTNINVKQSVVLLFLLMIPQIAFCDNQQDKLNLDYFRTPEASAFKKYGEESVNEYTGTADISVPLYTIKSKDVEIPLVLRYDASGIKVEQEASWVGLGWNLMVGGCINYVCAGGHDMYQAQQVENKAWTEYLTSEFGLWTVGDSIREYDYHPNIFTHETLEQVDTWATRSRIIYYTYNPQDKFNWMGKLPLRYQNFVDSYVDVFSQDGMDKYIDWGYGERDFYSVNVMGKSFMFFIDPATLKVFNIGKAGEDFTVYPDYEKTGLETGIGKQPDVKNWKITDSDGYIYKFKEGDKFKRDSRTGLGYTSCWYLTEIQSPMGETVEFEYAELEKPGRLTLAESVKLPFFHDLGAFCCGEAADQIRTSYSNPLQSENDGMSVKSHYLSKIRTSNQTVTFNTSNDNKCSGKKLDAIKVVSYDGTTIKNINFSYGSFTSSNIGGNYAPKDPSIKTQNRLKLNNVKETVSGDTLTTSFSYNEKKQLPSKRSYAQDYWGYYNGRENKVGNKYTMIPTPQYFMSSHYVEKALSQYSNIGGADRNSRGEYMQAAILNKVVYPTGGYTTYEYEPNTCAVTNILEAGIPYDINITKDYSYTPDVPAGVSSVSNEPYNFTLKESLDYRLEVKCNGDAINGSSISIIIVSMTLAGTPILFPLKYQGLNNYITVDEGTLPAGNYQLTIGAPAVGNKGYGISCRLTGYYKSTTSAKTFAKAVGGLRVAKISNFDHNDTPINYTTYSYDGSTLLNRIETIDYMKMFNGSPKPGDYSIGNISHYIDVYTITSGHPHMPAFYASCNPGIVGYSKVTKNRYNANGSLEKSIVTSYMNNGPTNMYGVDYYTGLNNGVIMNQEIRNASGAVVATTKNDYVVENVDHYATNIIAKQKYVGIISTNSCPYYEFQERYDKNGAVTREKVTLFPNLGAYDILRYPYILSRVELAKTTTTETGPNGNVVSTKEYKYNPVNHQVSQIDEKASLPNQFRRTKITYSADGTDNISKSMKNAHWLNNVIENKVFLVENNQEKNCISTQHTYYDMINSSSCFLPKSYATSIGSNALETRAKYSYDKKGNVSSIEVDGIETVYIWSYLGQYPIAKIEGLTLAKVKTAVSESTINSLLDKAAPTASDLSSLRTKINSAGGHITTYTFKPLVGIASETLPNGLTVNYEYDAFGRLAKASDPQGVMQKYQYNYKVK